MTQFDDSVKEEIRSRIDIAVVIGRYVNLKSSSGQTLKGLCPFHKEKTPSFQVNALRGFFYCFGCGKGGDVFTFIEQIEGVSFPEALAMLGNECGVEVRKQHSDNPLLAKERGVVAGDTSEPSASSFSKTDLRTIHHIAAKFYYRNIRKNPEAVSYFKSRGLLPQTVKEFGLGFADDGWTSLIDFCKKENISEQMLVSCGLAIKKEDTGRWYDRFRNRIIFPLRDITGKVIGFAGRTMNPDGMPKYLNSPETLLYKKKMYLYGLDRAKTAVKEADAIIVVEGYMDYLTLYQAGIANVVATSGTALTSEHGRLIARFTKRIFLLFDGDAAGQSAIEKAVFILAPLGLDCMTLSFPNNEDPDSYIRSNGRESLLKLMETAQPWSEFIINRMMNRYNASTPVGKSAVLEALSPLAASLWDPVIAQHFIKELAEKLRLNEKLVHAKLRTQGSKTPLNVTTLLTRDQHYLSTLEGSFLHILVARPEFIDEARVYVSPETLTDGLSGDIYSLILKAYEREHTLKGIADSTADPEIKRLLSLFAVKDIVGEHIHDELAQKIVYLRKKYLRSRQRECTIRMVREPHRSEELLHMQQEYLTQLHELDGGE